MEKADAVVPLYHRVYVLLMQQLSDGSFPLGQTLPSEDELAARYSVSRITIRKAMERLDREGRISRQRGRGTFPLPNSAAPRDNWLIESDKSLAQTTSVKLLEYNLIQAPAAVAEQFGLHSGEQVLRIIRVRSSLRSPISYTICYLPADLATIVPMSEIGALPVSVILTKAGLVLEKFEDRLSAVLADTQNAPHLEVEVGSAIVMMTRSVRTSDGRPVQILRAFYRPDRYEYTVEYSAGDEAMRARWGAINE